MPFTFAHSAIVLSLYKKFHLFPMKILIICSMSPDFKYFLRMEVKSTSNDSITGIFI
ncbi:DUF4184 family protein [Gilliamella apicola]|jgi:hypothetical protein|uniref:DUF4184 family protein n=1 Tax=unclassified Gilliamella TaxID=2685620 RepID=UPI0009BF5EC8